MAENRGRVADLPPGGGVNEVRRPNLGQPDVPPEPVNLLDLDLDYTGENGDGQTERVGDGTLS